MRGSSRTRVLLLAILAVVLVGSAFAQVRDHRVGHWRIWADIQNRVEGTRILHNSKYRLATLNGQLAYDRQSRGAELVNTALNIRIMRAVFDPNYGDTPKVGNYVRVNEKIAIYEQNGKYFVYKGGPGIGIGWQAESHFSPASAPDVYQWEFRSVPDSNRQDHRDRDIVTGEQLSLYNVVKKEFLVSKSGRLSWIAAESQSAH